MTTTTREPRPSRVVASGVDAVLNTAVLAVASWTVVFQISIIVGIRRNPATLLWLIVWATTAAAFRTPRSGAGRRGAPPRNEEKSAVAPDLAAKASRVSTRPDGSRWLLGGCALAIVVAIAQPNGLEWPLTWIILGTFAAAALGAAGQSARHDRSRANPLDDAPMSMMTPTSVFGTFVVLALAVLFAGLSLITSRPDADDVFVVNRSSYVESVDTTFPERDTIFSDELFAVERPSTPQTAIEALIGAVAAALPVSAAGLTYLGVGPLVSGLAVLAMWRLIQAFGVRRPALAVFAGSAFIFLDGESHRSFGNFNFARAWQGKTIFLIVLVPLLWRSCLEFGRSGSRRHLAIAVAVSVASVGCTTSAIFIVPLIATVVMASTAHVSNTWIRGAIGVAAIMVAPAVAGLANLMSSAQSPRTPNLAFIDIGIQIGDIDPSSQLYIVLGTGAALAVGLGAVLVGWLFVPNPEARVAVAAATTALVGVLLAPGILDRIDAVSSAESVLWRVVWIIPVPALVGIVAAALVGPVAGALRPIAALPAVAALAMFGWGQPVLSSDNAALTVEWPPPYDLPAGTQTAAETLRDLAPKGATVGAPQPVGFALAVTNVDVRAVNPRWVYLGGRHVIAEFETEARDTVSRWLTDGIPEGGGAQFVDALATFDIAVLCQGTDAGGITEQVLTAAGYSPVATDEICVYWVADDTSNP